MSLFLALSVLVACTGGDGDTSSSTGDGPVCATIEGSPHPGGYFGCLPMSWDDEVAWSIIAMSGCSDCGASLYTELALGDSVVSCTDGITSVKLNDPEFGAANFAFAGIAGYGDNEVSAGECTLTTRAWEVDEASGVVHLNATVEATMVVADRDTLAMTGQELTVIIEIDATEDVTP